MSEIKPADPKPIEKAEGDKTLFERVDSVIKAVLDRKLGPELDARVENIVKARLAEKDDQIEKALRASFGVGEDIPLTEKDIPRVMELMRKAALEQSEPQKRTPAPEMKGGPDGNTQPDPFETLMKQKGLVE